MVDIGDGSYTCGVSMRESRTPSVANSEFPSCPAWHVLNIQLVSASRGASYVDMFRGIVNAS
jgi:hypothetical protein